MTEPSLGASKSRYAIQPQTRGIGPGFSSSVKRFHRQSPQGFAPLILGDNIFYGHGLVQSASAQPMAERIDRATIFAYWVHRSLSATAWSPSTIRPARPLGIEEKPVRHPKSNWAVTGLYFYDPSVVVQRAQGPGKPSTLEGNWRSPTVNQHVSTWRSGNLEVEQSWAAVSPGLTPALTQSLVVGGLERFVETIEQPAGFENRLSRRDRMAVGLHHRRSA